MERAAEARAGYQASKNLENIARISTELHRAGLFFMMVVPDGVPQFQRGLCDSWFA